MKSKQSKAVPSFIIIIALAVCMLIPAITINCDISKAEVATQFSKNIEKMRKKFPDGKYWNHYVNSASEAGDALKTNNDESFADSVTDYPCAIHGQGSVVGKYDCNYFDGAQQCFGFAHKIFYDVFGERASGRYLAVSSVGRNDIRAGDVVRIGEFGNNGHSAFVLSRSGDTLTVVECNNGYHGGNCNIKWDSQMSVNSVTYYCRATNYDEMMKPIDIPLSEATVTVPDATYTGKKLTPKPVVTYEGQTLVRGTDYKCLYKNNKNIGLATVVITGIGNCTGTVKENFKIIPKGVSISKVTATDTTLLVVWKPQLSKPAINGYQIGYSNSSDMNNQKVVSVSNRTTPSKMISNLDGNTTYYIQLRTYKKVGKNTYYSNWSEIKEAMTRDATSVYRSQSVMSTTGGGPSGNDYPNYTSINGRNVYLDYDDEGSKLSASIGDEKYLIAQTTDYSISHVVSNGTTFYYSVYNYDSGKNEFYEASTDQNSKKLYSTKKEYIWSGITAEICTASCIKETITIKARTDGFSSMILSK